MMTDPIADMLTRIRNAVAARHRAVDIPSSKMKKRLAEILTAEGYIEGFEALDEGVQGVLRVQLRYDEDTGQSPIHGLERVSTPGCRVYSGKDGLPEVLGGLGISVVSTPKGLMTGKAAMKVGVGGEVLCKVW
jgi:small subunit ribosomal protein S8